MWRIVGAVPERLVLLYKEFPETVIAMHKEQGEKGRGPPVNHSRPSPNSPVGEPYGMPISDFWTLRIGIQLFSDFQAISL